MKARPILFSAPMVLALLAGAKTQTRRVPGMPSWADPNGAIEVDENGVPHIICTNTGCLAPIPCPYGKPGDLLWVREHWRTTGDGGRADYLPPRDLQPHPVWHEADGPAPADQCVGKLRPSMFMPRWASRLTPRITDVRVQRLQEISEADAISEGIERFHGGWKHYMPGCGAVIAGDPQTSYGSLWESINGAGSWNANPWVWAITFEVIRQNVDEVLARHPTNGN